MPEDLHDEVEAIQSIYGDHILRKINAEAYILSIPPFQSSQSKVSVRIYFPSDYPESSPQVLGTETIGETARKGYGRYMIDLVRQTFQKVFTPGSVFVFDLLQDLEVSLSNDSEDLEYVPLSRVEEVETSVQMTNLPLPPAIDELPEWIISTPVTEKKSTFLARACCVNSPQQAQAFIGQLLYTDKRAAKATHNITAYRIRSRTIAGSMTEIIYQDCDDDGETAAGGRLLHLLQIMDVWDVLVVVSRWYGGVKLGPDRFSIINNVAREAVVGGGWTTGRVAKD